MPAIPTRSERTTGRNLIDGLCVRCGQMVRRGTGYYDANAGLRHAASNMAGGVTCAMAQAEIAATKLLAKNPKNPNKKRGRPCGK